MSPLFRENLRSKPDLRSKTAYQLLSQPSKLLHAILTGNILVNVAATTLLTSILIDKFPGYGAEIAIPIMTVVLLLFGEITPKVISSRWNLPIALAYALPMRYLLTFLSPVVWILGRISNFFIGGKIECRKIDEADLKAQINLLGESGTLKPAIATALFNSFELDAMPVSRFGIWRDKWVFAPLNTEISALRELFRNTGTRFVVITDGDVIVGVIEPELLLEITDNVEIADICQVPICIDGQKTVNAALALLFENGIRWIFIRDEKDANCAIIGFESILRNLLAQEFHEGEAC